MKAPIEQIKPNPKNPRVIRDEKFTKLKKSLQDFPQMLEKRPLVVFTDTDGKFVVLGGNMRLKAAKELGMTELPIIVADDWTEEQKAEFLIKDNVGFGEWDWSELQADWDVEQLENWGLDVPKQKELNEEDLFDINLPFYTPSEVQPEIKELANLDKTKELIEKIDLLEVDNKLKEILKIRAAFFTDFNFQKIADYFHKENQEVQEVFKELGLVVLAPKEALQKGFIELSDYLIEE